ncbi:MAG TPA: uracil-DNA glycosylase [Capsulimonadaceae bacterium]
MTEGSQSSDREAREEAKERKRLEIARLGELAQTCTACELSERRTKVVFGVGNPTSPLMLIGEGPGASEDALGEPFVGPAGKLLDACLQLAGMKREHIYLTNIIKCRASVEQSGRIQNRPPTPLEIDTCAPLWLQKQIDAVGPLVICCIGGPAAKTIINPTFGIMRDHGRFFECKYAPHAIAALHPAYILRMEGDAYERGRQSLIDDLAAAKERAIAAKREPSRTLF